MSLSRLTLALNLALFSSVACAATPVGKWTGKIIVTVPPLPANAPAQQKQAYATAMAQVAKARIMLDLKADKTYTGMMTGVPAANANTKGKWTQKGNAVTFTESKPGEKPQTMMLSKDGKTMTMTMPRGQGKILFSR